MANLGVHQTHCCKQHGCKYSWQGEPCPVEDGEVEQAYSCEQCRPTDSIRRQIEDLQAELAWSQKLEERGLTLVEMYDYDDR